MFKQIDSQEMTAAKTEVREAMLRRYQTDGRDPAAVFGAMTTILGELIGEMIAAGAQDKEHREKLALIVSSLIKNRMEAVAK